MNEQEELIAHLDFETEVKCEYCPRDAGLLLTSPCCGRNALLCVGHVALIQTAWDEMSDNPEATMICPACRAYPCPRPAATTIV